MNAFTKLYSTMSFLEARLEDKRDEQGVTAIEYALMAGAIVAVVATGVGVLGGKVSGIFNNISV